MDIAEENPSRIQYVTPDELAGLKRVSAVRGLVSVAFTWTVIFGCFALYIWRPGIVTFLIGWTVISGRHLALAILMHDGAHGALHPGRKWNDRLGQWLTAYPIFSNMIAYRMNHLQHHRYTWTGKDPDRDLAAPFPITRKSFRRKMLRDLTGQTGWQRYKLIARLSAGLPPSGKGLGGRSLISVLRTFAQTQRGFLITNGILLAGLTLAGHPEAFLLLWWLPAFTGYSVVLRIRSIAEHACVSDPANELRQTRTTLAPFWVRFFLAPHSVNYHLEHHLYMYVPHYRLRKLHEILKNNGTLARAEIASGYREVLRKATSASDEPSARKRRAVLPVFSN